MNTPFFEYYISVYDKNGLLIGYGKKMSKDTFTIDGVKMILDTDPNYQITDIDLSDKVLDIAGFCKFSTSQYKLPAQPNDIFYHIPVMGNKIVEVLFRGGNWYYVKPNKPSIELKPVKTIAAIQAEAINECPNIILPLLNTIINRKKLSSYLTSHIQGRYTIESKRIDENGKIKHSDDNYDILLLEPIEVNAFPVIELKLIDPRLASVKIYSEGTVEYHSRSTWADVVKANASIITMSTEQVKLIQGAYNLIFNSIKHSLSC